MKETVEQRKIPEKGVEPKNNTGAKYLHRAKLPKDLCCCHPRPKKGLAGFRYSAGQKCHTFK